jgi:hypothetical protein
LERLAQDDWRPRTRSDLAREAKERELDPAFPGFAGFQVSVGICR